jgi:CubicO group peptidase (beta-lactamase class C family)
LRRLLALFLILFGPAAFAAGPIERIDAIGFDAIAHHRAPGLAIGVMRHGRIIFAKGYGLADVGKGVPVTPASAFAIASVTKTLTAVAILQLAERRALSLDDDIGTFLPDFPHRNEGVTIRRLLDHTAGIHDLTSIPAYWAQIGKPIEPAKLIAFFRDAPLDFPPGTSYSYSNSGYILLGAVIEKASGLSYADYLRSHVLTELSDSTYCGGAAIVPRRVRGYTKSGGGFVNARPVDMSQGYAAGGVCSSLRDLLRLQDRLHHGKLLAKSTYARMIDAAPAHSYALGIGVGSSNGHRVLYHAGGISGFDAMVTHYPDDDVSIVVLANADGELSGEIEHRVARIVLGIPPPGAVPLTPQERQRFAGTYKGGRGTVTLFVRGETLLLDAPGGSPTPLVYLGRNIFAGGGGALVVATDGKTLKLTQYGATRFEGRRVP